jgi:hypothetical protein
MIEKLKSISLAELDYGEAVINNRNKINELVDAVEEKMEESKEYRIVVYQGPPQPPDDKIRAWTTIYEQTVESINLQAVIAAVNAPDEFIAAMNAPKLDGHR